MILAIGKKIWAKIYNRKYRCSWTIFVLSASADKGADRVPR